MEDKYLIDLSVKYGLNSEELSKLVDIGYQAGYQNTSDRGFHRVAEYVCDMELLNEMTTDEIIEELKRKKLIQE
ncbi:MAG: hypothetical protein O3B47_05120 [bacterium]|nr:hypothetical protein [bacterium]